MTPSSRRSPLVRFLLKAIASLLLLMVAWSFVSKWTSYPVAFTTHWALDVVADDWVQSIHQQVGVIEVQTRLTMRYGGKEADIVVEADPARYAYSLPIFLALLLAASGSGDALRRGKLAALGYFILLPCQTFSLSMDLLKQMAVAMPGGARALGIAQWQLEGIALGYQLGSLVVPTLIPIVLWVWLDKAYVTSLTKPND